MRILLATTASTLLLGTGLALAQPTTPSTPTTPGAPAATTLREVEDGKTMVTPFNLSVDDLEDMDIYDAGGNEIAEVEEVLADASGQVVAITAEVGGFLGIGDKEVVLRLDQLQRQNDRLVTNLTKDQLKALEAWKGD